jgi:hypothetical protein
MSLHQELFNRCSILQKATWQEVSVRLRSILNWMDSQTEIKRILDDLRTDLEIRQIVEQSDVQSPPQAANARQIAGVGLALVDACEQQKNELAALALHCGIDGPGSEMNYSSASDAAMERYVIPFFNYVLSLLPEDAVTVEKASLNQPFAPVAIQESLAAFKKEHPSGEKTCFIMMQFSGTTAHAEIEQTIKATLSKYSFTGLLARDRQYHEDLYPNIQTYMHGCGFGIAVFERIEKEEFNPNVSLEVGYLFGLKKSVLLLKEQTLRLLPADLTGKLYRPFDVQNVAKTIPQQIERWMEDKSLI